MTPPRHAVVVSHTHWDREWYRTVHEFRVWLADVVGRVLDALEDDPAFRHFLLDGQAIVLEDYLEYRPEDEARVREHIAAGRLSVGPWYVLPDNFLIAPETQVRNLLVGRRVAGGYGPVQRAGYMPDSFGHPAQLPQLLAAAGIDSFFYWRGNGDELDDLGLEYRWEAPDGSGVTAVNLWSGYCNAAGLGSEEIWHVFTPRTVELDRAVGKVRDLLAALAERSTTDVALVMNGCDHHPPQRELGAILDRLQREIPDTTFEHASLARYLELLRGREPAAKTFRGELVSGKYSHILTGVWSARMPLKQENERCSRLLAAELEPVAAYTRFIHGASWPGGMLDRLWRELLKNQPHDSICGCSTDEVHRDMEPRFKEVAETGEAWLSGALGRLNPAFAPGEADDYDTTLCVVNPLPIPRSEVVERLVVLQPKCPDASGLRLLDAAGREVPMEIVETTAVERFWGVDYRTMLDFPTQHRAFRRGVLEPDVRVRETVETELTDRFVHLRFRTGDLPGLGHAVYRLTGRPASGTTTIEDPVLTGADWIENGRVRVMVHPDGGIDLHDKATGRVFPGLNRLEDDEDAGDEYDFSPAPKSGRCGPTPGDVIDGGSTELTGALFVRFEMLLPEGLTTDRGDRRPSRVRCPVLMRVRLRSGSPLVDVELSFQNRVRDHRLRTRFPTAIDTDRLVSDGHFLVDERPVDRPTGDGWVQPPLGTMPQQGFSAVEDAGGGLAVFNRGLPEIEPIRETAGTGMALTLLRAVGWLSRDDFPTRRNQHAGPMICTPEAQCPGPHTFRYAVVAYSGSWLDADIPGMSDRWRTRVLSVQGVETGAAPGSGLLTVTGPGVRVSAIKRHEKRDTLVVRLVNLAPHASTATLTLGVPVTAAWRVNLVEERGEVMPWSGSTAETTLGAHRIETFELELSAPASAPGPSGR